MPHPTTNIERLTNLARVVAAAPEHRFHMRTFREVTKCGTAYCAAGWAAVEPVVRSAKVSQTVAHGV